MSDKPRDNPSVKPPLDVVLSADIECDVAGALTFPTGRTPLGIAAIERPTDRGEGGLGYIVDTLERHGLIGSFLVESLATRHFGSDYLKLVCERIHRRVPHEIELHLHPEWKYFDCADWRTSLTQRRLQGWRPEPRLARRDPQELSLLLEQACAAFEHVLGRSPRIFRAGGLSMPRALYKLLVARNFVASSSVGVAIDTPDEAAQWIEVGGSIIDDMLELPVTSFSDFRLGSQRHLRALTVIGCTFGELRAVLHRAWQTELGFVVLLTHPSECSRLVPGGSGPDFAALALTMRRFDRLCAHLASQPERYRVTTLLDVANRHGRSLRSPPEMHLHIRPWGLPRRIWESRQLAH